MNRREFLATTAAGVLSLALPQIILASAPKPRAKTVKLAEDHFELILDHPERFRMLQITDTHFGSPTDYERLSDEKTYKMLKGLIQDQAPDFVFHSGDFINNDKEHVEFSKPLNFINDLGVPCGLIWGNHDHFDGQVGGMSMDDYHDKLETPLMGYTTVQDNGVSKRVYCYRIDVRGHRGKPVLSIYGFNTGGGGNVPAVVSLAQLQWFRQQMERDHAKGVNHPIWVMQHIPTVEYKEIYGHAGVVGRQGESVCFGEDHGDVFRTYVEARRVKGVFCGHDHVNDYTGVQDGVRLCYGRVSSWSGYGDWQRGARLVALNNSEASFKTRVVLPAGAVEKPEWSLTLSES